MAKKRKDFKPSDEHEHTWQYKETHDHGDGEHCYHYICKARGCHAGLGINMSGEKITSHKTEEK